MINLPSTDNNLSIYCHHLPTIDEYPTTTLKKWQRVILTQHNTEETIAALLQQAKVDSVNDVFDATPGIHLECMELIKTSGKGIWKKAFGTELGRLVQGYKKTRIKEKNATFFTPWHKMPKTKKPTHARTCCSYRPKKVENIEQEQSSEVTD